VSRTFKAQETYQQYEEKGEIPTSQPTDIGGPLPVGRERSRERSDIAIGLSKTTFQISLLRRISKVSKEL
jgi:hypothetical protein